MDKLLPLLEKLAVQLGTTTELLWRALVRQALFDGITSILQYIILGAGIYGTVKLWRLCARLKQKSGYSETIFAWPIGATLVVTIASICAVFSLSDTAAAFLNPEYWALHHVLSMVRPCE